MDVDALSVLFRGAAINGGIILFSVICFYVVSSVLLLCSCVSLAHPRKKFNRGVCCGGSFWLMLETLNSALQVQINHNTLSLSLSFAFYLQLQTSIRDCILILHFYSNLSHLTSALSKLSEMLDNHVHNQNGFEIMNFTQNCKRNLHARLTVRW